MSIHDKHFYSEDDPFGYADYADGEIEDDQDELEESNEQLIIRVVYERSTERFNVYSDIDHTGIFVKDLIYFRRDSLKTITGTSRIPAKLNLTVKEQY